MGDRQTSLDSIKTMLCAPEKSHNVTCIEKLPSRNHLTFSYIKIGRLDFELYTLIRYGPLYTIVFMFGKLLNAEALKGTRLKLFIQNEHLLLIL